jgi:preprotein translocase subunit YajC
MLGSAEIIVLLAVIGGIIAFFAVRADKKRKKQRGVK